MGTGGIKNPMPGAGAGFNGKPERNSRLRYCRN
jgi:hypothetical protein